MEVKRETDTEKTVSHSGGTTEDNHQSVLYGVAVPVCPQISYPHCVFISQELMFLRFK